MTAMKAIRKHCLMCTCGSPNEIKACPVLSCPLWELRLGFTKYSQKAKNNPFLNKDNFLKLEPNLRAGKAIREIEKLAVI